MVYCRVKIFSVYSNDKYNIIMDYIINKNEYNSIMTRNSCNIKKVIHNKFLSTWICCIYMRHICIIDICMRVRNTYTYIYIYIYINEFNVHHFHGLA